MHLFRSKKKCPEKVILAIVAFNHPNELTGDKRRDSG